MPDTPIYIPDGVLANPLDADDVIRVDRSGRTMYTRVEEFASDPAFTAQYASLSTTPTVEELTASAQITTTISTNSSYPIWVAPFACNIVAAELVIWNSDVTASDTNYWTVHLNRFRDNAATFIGTKTTQTTGGEAITRRTAWNFDSVTFDATYKQFAKGDILGITTTPTGAPSSLTLLTLTARYEPT